MHPQTQGKVERFHLTAKLEVDGGVFQPTTELAHQACKAFVDRYNWVRPHEAISQKVPGSLYAPWPRKRPNVPPVHQIPEGSISRMVCEEGEFSFKGKRYNISRGLIGERIILKEAEEGLRIFYANIPLMYLADLESGPGRE